MISIDRLVGSRVPRDPTRTTPAISAVAGCGFEPSALSGRIDTPEKGRLLMWSAYPAQQVVPTTPLSGLMPTTPLSGLMPGLSDTLVSVGTDLGRPVVRLNTFLAHGAGSSVTVRFQGGEGPYGPLDVTTTPMVKPTEVTVTESPC